MRYFGKSCAIAVSAAAVTAGLFTLFTPSALRVSAAVQDTPGRVAGKPDFNGIWQANNTANWDLQTHEARPMVSQPGLLPGSVVLAAPVVGLGSIGWVPGGLGVVEGDEIPYQPWAAARKKENLEHWLDRDPEIKCFQPGVPRAMYMPHPFQIIQSATQDHDGFRIRECTAHHSSKQDGRLSEHAVHGIFSRPLGRRHAGRRRHRFHRCDVVRPVRELS